MEIDYCHVWVFFKQQLNENIKTTGKTKTYLDQIGKLPILVCQELCACMRRAVQVVQCVRKTLHSRFNFFFGFRSEKVKKGLSLS